MVTAHKTNATLPCRCSTGLGSKKGRKKSIPAKFPQILVYRSNSCKYLNSASILLLHILIKKKATRKDHRYLLDGQIIAFDSPQQQYTSYPCYFRDHKQLIHHTAPSPHQLHLVQFHLKPAPLYSSDAFTVHQIHH